MNTIDYELKVVKSGTKFYRAQKEECLDLYKSFHNPTKGNNWNDSLYLFKDIQPARGYIKGYDEINKKFFDNNLIEYTLCKDLEVIWTNDEAFATGKLPEISHIVSKTQAAIKGKYSIESKFNLNYTDGETTEYSFMLKLGEKGFAFSCYENTDHEIEVIIPQPLLEGLFTQQKVV